MSKRPLKVTDRRRQKHGSKAPETEDEGNGNASPLSNLFNDRRRPNGQAKRAF